MSAVSVGSLSTVAAASMALSYDSVRLSTRPYFGHWASFAVPLVADLLALGASAQYVSTIRERGSGGRWWQLTAHAAIGVSIFLNITGTHGIGRAYHAVPPIALAVLLELVARSFAKTWKAENADPSAIPMKLWITAPIEQIKTVLRAARTGASIEDARRDAGAHEAAHLSIDLASGRKVSRRRLLRSAHRQLSMGTVLPAEVLTATRNAHHETTPAHRVALSLLSLPTPSTPVLTPEQTEQDRALTEQTVLTGEYEVLTTEQAVLRAHQENPSATDSEIAALVGAGRSTVNRYRKGLR